MPQAPQYTVEFYEDDDGSSSVFRWITEELSPTKRRAVNAALEQLVAYMGPEIVNTDFGKNLGGGIIELRLRQREEQILKRIGKEPKEPHPEDEGEDILLRIFFHSHGQKRALVLHGYDKGQNSSERHQNQQIATAQKRLARFKEREKEKAKAEAKKQASLPKSKGRK
jgi:phage-related protein